MGQEVTVMLVAVGDHFKTLGAKMVEYAFFKVTKMDFSFLPTTKTSIHIKFLISKVW